MDRSESKSDWSFLALMAISVLPTALLLVIPFLSHWTPLEWIGLIGVLAASALAMTALLFWRRVRLAQADAACKQGLLQKGLSADDAERLIRGGEARAAPPRARPSKTWPRA